MAVINISDNPKIFEMGYHAGFKDGVEGSIPREKIDEMIAEIEKIDAWGDQFGNVYVLFEAVMDIIHKYCDKEQKNE